MKKPTRIYLKPHKLKRGHKLTELSHNSTYKECLNWLNENLSFKHGEDTLFRSWCKNGKTIIDYGSYSNYLVVNKELRPE